MGRGGGADRAQNKVTSAVCCVLTVCATLNHYRNCRVCRMAEIGSFPALIFTYRIRISP